MKELTILTSLLLLVVSNGWAEEESLDIEFFSEYKSCNELMAIMHERWKHKESYYELFKDGGLPECINNELPESWVESRTTINDYAYTVCKIPCNVRFLPILVDPVKGIGHIPDSKKIFIMEKIEVNENLLDIYKDDLWYKFWYSFNDDGKKLYIHTDNVMLSDEVPSYRLIKHGGRSYEVDSKLEIRNHLYYEINTQEPFTGRTVGKNYRGWIEVINYKNGKKHGLNEWFYNIGQSFIRTHYKNGKRDGLSEMFDENGEEYSSSPWCYKEGEETDMSYCNN